MYRCESYRNVGTKLYNKVYHNYLFGGSGMFKLRKFTLALSLIYLMQLGFPSVFVSADDIAEEKPANYIFSDSDEPVTGDPVIDAAAAIVIEAESGRVLYSKNATAKRSIASTTKIMTALIALENGNLEDIVTVSKKAASVRGSNINLQTGQKFRLKELLYGLLLNSGNDAAVAIAEHIGGTEEKFAEMMNAEAKRLGAENTNYITPHGLDRDGQYSTAYDLAIITRHALKNPVFAEIVSTNISNIPGRQLYNTNELLEVYPGADGVKTGYTGKAGRCLVASATRSGMRLISVVLGSPTRYKRAASSKAVLDYAFKTYKMYELVKAGSICKNIPVYRGRSNNASVRAAETIRLPLSDEEYEKLETRVYAPDILKAPVYAGADIGYMEYVVDDKVVGETMLKTWENVGQKNYFDYLGAIIRKWAEMMREGIFDAG